MQLEQTLLLAGGYKLCCTREVSVLNVASKIATVTIILLAKYANKIKINA